MGRGAAQFRRRGELGLAPSENRRIGRTSLTKVPVAIPQARCCPPSSPGGRGGSAIQAAVLLAMLPVSALWWASTLSVGAPLTVNNAAPRLDTAGHVTKAHDGSIECTSALDCALSGECTAGRCVCDVGWKIPRAEGRPVLRST